MDDMYDLIIIGAGIVGLSLLDHANKKGLRILCIEKGMPGQEQSAGGVRILRYAHINSENTDLALRAHDGWIKLERRSGMKFLQETGKLSFSSNPTGYVSTTWSTTLVKEEWQKLLPTHTHIRSSASFEPMAGVLFSDKIIKFLISENAGVIKNHTEVSGIICTNQSAVVQAGGSSYYAKKVCIAAGVATPQIMDTLGVHIDIRKRYHLRQTFRLNDCDRILPVISDSTNLYDEKVYGCAIDNNHYVLGLSDMNDNLAAPNDSHYGDIRKRLESYANRAFSLYNPLAVDETKCVSTYLAGDDEDRFEIFRSGNVYAIAGHNLFKFGSVMGELLFDRMKKDHVSWS